MENWIFATSAALSCIFFCFFFFFFQIEKLTKFKTKTKVKTLNSTKGKKMGGQGLSCPEGGRAGTREREKKNQRVGGLISVCFGLCFLPLLFSTPPPPPLRLLSPSPSLPSIRPLSLSLSLSPLSSLLPFSLLFLCIFSFLFILL